MIRASWYDTARMKELSRREGDATSALVLLGSGGRVVAAKSVVAVDLLRGEEGFGFKVSAQVDEPKFGAQAGDPLQGLAQGGLVDLGVAEREGQLRLRLENLLALGLGRGQHPIVEALDRFSLVRAKTQVPGVGCI